MLQRDDRGQAGIKKWEFNKAHGKRGRNASE